MQTPTVIATPIHRSITPLFALDLKNPTRDEIRVLHKKLSAESGGKKPGFWSCGTLLDYISSLFCAGGLITTFLGFSKENNGTKGVGIGLVLLSIGAFVCGAFNKIDFNVGSNQDAQTKDKDSSLTDESISGLMETVRNKELEFCKRECAYDKLHGSLMDSYSHEYDPLITELRQFDKQKKESIESIKDRIDKLETDCIESLGKKEKFRKNFSELLNISNNKQLPTTSRSNALVIAIKLIQGKWIHIDPVNEHVKKVLCCLFDWIETIQEHPIGKKGEPVISLINPAKKNGAMNHIRALSESIKENSGLGHDLSKYDDFIQELEKRLKSDDYYLQEAARIFIEETKHPLGVKPLIESLRIFDPIKTKNRISRDDFRKRITIIVKAILKDTRGAPGLGQNVSAALERDLFKYLDDANNDVVIVASQLVDPKSNEVRTKLLNLLDREDIILKSTILMTLSDSAEHQDVKDKLTDVFKKESEDPFLRYKAGEILGCINATTATTLLIASLHSKCPTFVETAAIKLRGTKDENAILPLIEAGTNGSLEALFTLYGMKINRMGETNINEFLKVELPKHLEKYAKTHVHYTNINRTLKELNGEIDVVAGTQ
jgi:Txe/YoeB family toxin of Txe-Axe toxin-antitoxin module